VRYMGLEDYYKEGEYVWTTVMPGTDVGVVKGVLRGLRWRTFAVPHEETVRELPGGSKGMVLSPVVGHQGQRKGAKKQARAQQGGMQREPAWQEGTNKRRRAPAERGACRTNTNS
jgi:hypothetical protein